MSTRTALKSTTALLAVLLSCLLFLAISPGFALELMLPQSYNLQSAQPVSGWLMSEKLDGVRGYWNGKQLLSKNGIAFSPPAEFIRDLPPFALEGELWGGRGRFQRTVSIVKRQQSDGWLHLKFAIFDVPEADGGFSARIERAIEWFRSHPSEHAFVIAQTPVRSQEHLLDELQRIEQLGGEGLIVRNPAALYSAGRSAEILKVKNYRDAEATVVAHLPGKGRNQNRLGALLVELGEGTRFKIGSGFSDAERESPPPLGAIITFKYYGTYKSGIPKFPSFLRVRSDVGL
ncbi:DNA ligase-1 [Malonomonas rubra DSM 5091]|uniref:DNA ligase-1 n=1 Tax=Malonomonas rubra DSM 5091 TaxID=1122189 RepID=A0A1M6H7S6_MALRU|nr:DNA ligase [Malonomonas rubra]SHJ18214.1 DNA ligase-1 [Malonomonas rubra DSM 5091]